jgi:O-acetyl-ADP-ribose deacetylase (regulator of RNase III)
MDVFVETDLVALRGDITQLQVDAVVNAANRGLSGGGGVDGAIHRAAGFELVGACRKLGGCETGQVKVTPGFNLPAKYIFHAVGPVWQGGGHNEAALLASCYRNSMLRAKELKLASIAFPAISCGVYRFPLRLAAKIAVNEVRKVIDDHRDTLGQQLQQVIFCVFDGEAEEIYQELVAAGID